MDDFDDFRLEQTPDPVRPRPSRTVPVIVAVILLIALAAIWYYMRRRPELQNTPPNQSAQAAIEEPRSTAAAAPALPPLDESDAYVRDLVKTLSQNPTVLALLTTDGLIRTFTVSVMNIAEGDTPARHLFTIKPEGRFHVRREGTKTVVDPRSYSRYDTHAAAVDGIDPAGAARVYLTLKPRIGEAYKEVAGAGGDFDRALARAITELLETPVVEGPIALESRVDRYVYAEPSLQSLSHAQQQLIRMGPRNERIVQNKLRAIARELGINEASLPRERVLHDSR